MDGPGPPVAGGGGGGAPVVRRLRTLKRRKEEKESSKNQVSMFMVDMKIKEQNPGYLPNIWRRGFLPHAPAIHRKFYLPDIRRKDYGFSQVRMIVIVRMG